MSNCDLKPGCVRFADGGMERCAICAFNGDPRKNVILISYGDTKAVLANNEEFTRNFVPGVGILRRGNTVVVTDLLIDPSQRGPAEEFLLGVDRKRIVCPRGQTFFAEYLSHEEVIARI